MSLTDVNLFMRSWIRNSLIPENFANFWEDDPELHRDGRSRHIAESQLAIACVSAVGGRYDDVRDVVEAQEAFGLPGSERLDLNRMQVALGRLRGRHVLRSTGDPTAGTTDEIGLRVLRDWLAASSHHWHLVDEWKEYKRRERDRDDGADDSQLDVRSASQSPVVYVDERFPVPDGELLAVTEMLRGTHVTKDRVHTWLRQFNDDARIEAAWLLLHRLANEGFVNEGSELEGIRTLSERLGDLRRSIAGPADGKWRLTGKGRRYQDLCFYWADDGAAVVGRALRRHMPSGKFGSNAAEAARWILDNTGVADCDPIFAIVDDFAGSGQTLLKGLRDLRRRAESGFDRLVSDGRVVCCVLRAFADAKALIGEELPGVRVLAARDLGVEVRAFHPSSGIFATEEHLGWAKRAILAIGRDIQPGMPLGYGEMEALVAFRSSIPNNTLPIFWSYGTDRREWIPLIVRT